MLYNTDQTLWTNYKTVRRAMPNGGAPLSLYNGIVGNGREILARFKDDKAASKVLKMAGFIKDKRLKTWK